MHSQSPILKTKGALSSLVILTYLWEQSCILHFLTKTACSLYKFWPEKCSSMLEEWQPVKLCWHWQVQSLTKLAHTRKHDSQFIRFSIKCWGANCPKFLWVQLLTLSCNFVLMSLTRVDIVTIISIIISMSTANMSQIKTHLYSVKFKSQLTMKLEKQPAK